MTEAPSREKYLAGVAAYVVPTFGIAYLWHLVVFAHVYQDLAIYRDDVIVPFGFVTIVIQGFLFTSAYWRLAGRRTVWSDGLRYGALAGLLSWTYTTLAVAAKFPMTSVATFISTESAFTVVQFAVVGPLTAWALRADRR